MKSSTILISSILTFFAIFETVQLQCLTEKDDGNLLIPMKKTDRNNKSNLYRGQQVFTISMLKAINKATPNENIFFSPYSTYHALLLAYFGSGSTTEIELANALNLTWSENKGKVYQAYKAEKRIREGRDGINFASANKIFLDEDSQFRECMKNYFIEELENLNFKEKPEVARSQINNWISSITQNEIPEFLKQGDVTSATNMVLANAAYFKGQWESKFLKENTKLEPFHVGFDSSKFVEMMNLNGTFYLGLSEELGCHILELPYKGGKNNDISMMIFLPPMVNVGLQKVLDNLTPETLTAAINDFDSREIRVAVPKFTFEQRLELTPILNEIGIKELFTNQADLKTFAEGNSFQLGDAIHVAKIKVDEEGSTAAAATALFSFRSARPLEPTNFICNHPFLFLIYDHKSNAILFSGIYRSP